MPTPLSPGPQLLGRSIYSNVSDCDSEELYASYSGLTKLAAKWKDTYRLGPGKVITISESNLRKQLGQVAA